jgi:hypothetical protein
LIFHRTLICKGGRAIRCGISRDLSLHCVALELRKVCVTFSSGPPTPEALASARVLVHTIEAIAGHEMRFTTHASFDIRKPSEMQGSIDQLLSLRR